MVGLKVVGDESSVQPSDFSLCSAYFLILLLLSLLLLTSSFKIQVHQ